MADGVRHAGWCAGIPTLEAILGHVREVLIVDDDADIRETVGALLESEGHHVRTAENGADALAKIGERRPDVVLLDVRMPVMDGLEVHRRLRASDATRDLPVVVMSAFADLDEVTRELDAVRLRKPFGLDQLLRAVEGGT